MQTVTHSNYKRNSILRAILAPIAIIVFIFTTIAVETKAEVVIDISVLEKNNTQVSANTIDISIAQELTNIELTGKQDITTLSIYPYTQEDVILLAKIMYAEEGVLLTKYYDTEPEKVEETFKLAGSVVLNRREYHYMGAMTIKDVLYSKGQYASQTINHVNGNHDIPDIVYKWAEDLLMFGTIGPENLIYQAQFVQGNVYKHNWNQYFCVSDMY